VFRLFKKIPNTIKAIGVASFLLNTSTLMVYSVFGVYLHKNLGVNLENVGFLDGAVEGFSFMIKIFSGLLSDIMMNRKVFIVAGAIFLFIAKPLEAIASSYWSLFSAKMLERFGNGIQATPRDAIVGDTAPKDLQGSCFGIRHAMAALGSVAGAIIAGQILFGDSNSDFQFVFWMAAIPSFFAVIVILFFVKDKSRETVFRKEKGNRMKISLKDIKNFDSRYWTTMLIASLYMISRVTESIVILHVINKLKLPSSYAPTCIMYYQLANSAIALSAGIISDKLRNRDNIIISGIIVFFISDILFIFGNDMFTMMMGMVFLGGYVGIQQSIFHAKIIDVIPKEFKGTGLGIFYLVCAISLSVGGKLTGYISDHHSTTTAFVVSIGFATVSIIVMFVIKYMAPANRRC
jgi:predicted MFS family arabinose efflux permease